MELTITPWQYNSHELYHHGILGMKWGVRRFQKKDGSLTLAGDKRYSNDASKKKSVHRKKLERKYKMAGLSDDEAAAQADKRIKAEKIIAASAGVTLAAAAAYVVHSHIKDQADSIVKSGEKLQRIEYEKNGILHEAFYAAKEKSDKTKYAGQLGFTRQQQFGNAYKMGIGVNSDVKVAGRKSAIDAFSDLYKRDDSFRSKAKKYAEVNVHGKNAANIHDLSEANMKKLYDNFNSSLVYMRDDGVDKTFYNKLKSAGYGAVQDVNDKKFSGYKAKNPLIMFGVSDKVSVQSFEKMSDSEIYKALIADGAKEAGKTLATFGPAAVTAGMVLNDFDQTKPVKTDKKR